MAYDDLLYTKAAHYIANYQKVTNEHTLRFEVFYKKYDDLVKTYSSKGTLFLIVLVMVALAMLKELRCFGETGKPSKISTTGSLIHFLIQNATI